MLHKGIANECAKAIVFCNSGIGFVALVRKGSFSQRLKVLAFLDHSLDQACDSEGGMFWSAFSVAVL